MTPPLLFHCAALALAFSSKISRLGGSSKGWRLWVRWDSDYCRLVSIPARFLLQIGLIRSSLRGEAALRAANRRLRRLAVIISV